jgi:hypothetical protein
MVFDGARALVVGDYVTPRSGEYAGRLGPWSSVVRAVGIEPRSTFMKLVFVAYGCAWLVVAAAFVIGRPWAGKAMLIAAAGVLWYVPFGTLAGAVQIVLLIMFPALRR